MARGFILVVILVFHLRSNHVFASGNETDDCYDDKFGARSSPEFPYLGCYHSGCLISDCGIYNNSNMDITTCTNRCAKTNCAFAGLRHGMVCLCGSFLCDQPHADTRACDNLCGIPCDGTHQFGNFQLCGGRTHVQVYEVKRWTTETNLATDEFATNVTEDIVERSLADLSTQTTDQSASSPQGMQDGNQCTLDPTQLQDNTTTIFPYKVITIILSILIILICCAFVISRWQRRHRRQSRMRKKFFKQSSKRVETESNRSDCNERGNDEIPSDLIYQDMYINAPLSSTHHPSMTIETNALIHDHPHDHDYDASRSPINHEYFDVTKFSHTSGPWVDVDPGNDLKILVSMTTSSPPDGRFTDDSYHPSGSTNSPRDHPYDMVPRRTEHRHHHHHHPHHQKLADNTCCDRGYSEWPVPTALDLSNYQNI